ncbi:glycosyltransferase [Furfurilactobacillus entadae]|uniref:glycosyltransferase n=1 Tax=Furfurilactobacillus entadae TaxID=2922307 RepID=UPI0035F02F69
MKKVLLTGMGHQLGGTESFIDTLIDNNKDNIEWAILSATNDTVVKESHWNAFNIPVYKLKNIFGLKNALRRSKIFSEFLRGHNFDVLHINATTLNTVYMARAALKQGVSVVYQVHNTAPSGYSYFEKLLTSINKNIARYYLLKHPEIQLVSVSDEAAEKVFGTELAKKVKVIVNGISTDKYCFDDRERTQMRVSLELKENDYVGIVVARLMPIKNIQWLISIMANANQNVLQKLLIVGEGPERENLSALIKENGLQEKVVLLGEQKDVQKFLFAADLFLLTSYSEGLSISVIEAQASGLPVLVSEGIPKVTNITGQVFFMGLDQTEEKWIKEIQRIKQEHLIWNRVDSNNMVEKSEFSKERFRREILRLYGV